MLPNPKTRMVFVPLKAAVADLTTVEEAHRDLYVEKNGKFVLNVEGSEGFGLEDVTGLRNALAAERTAHSAVKNQFKPFEGLDPATVKTALERAEAFGDLDPKAAKDALTAAEKFSKFDPEKEAERIANEKFERSKIQLTSTFAEEKTRLASELATTKTALEKRQAQVERLLKQNTIATELAKLDPLDEARDVLEMIAAQSVKLVDVNGESVPVVVDASGNPRTKINPTDYSSIPVTVTDLLAEIKESRQALFKPSKTVAGLGLPAGGQARTPASGDYNPWAKGSVNVTQQVFMESKDPARAARLKAEAGIS